MNCPLHNEDGAGILLDYCSRHLDPGRASELQGHIADCADCRQVVEAQEYVWNALDAFEAQPVSTDFDRKLWARIDAEDSQSVWQRAWTRITGGPAIGWSNVLFGWKPVMAAATACVAIAAIMIATVPGIHNSADHPAGNNATDQKVLENVESALDEVDMLGQIGLVGPGTT
jgi:anti-sigma-K factor RskA